MLPASGAGGVSRSWTDNTAAPRSGERPPFGAGFPCDLRPGVAMAIDFSASSLGGPDRHGAEAAERLACGTALPGLDQGPSQKAV